MSKGGARAPIAPPLAITLGLLQKHVALLKTVMTPSSSFHDQHQLLRVSRAFLHRDLMLRLIVYNTIEALIKLPVLSFHLAA